MKFCDSFHPRPQEPGLSVTFSYFPGYYFNVFLAGFAGFICLFVFLNKAEQRHSLFSCLCPG